MAENKVAAQEGQSSFPVATKGSKAKLLFQIGSQGTGDGQFEKFCGAVAFSPDNTFWVGSAGRVQVFDSDGKFLRHAAKGKVEMPVCIAFGGGEAYIADYTANQVVVASLAGEFLRSFGGKGSGDGQFQCPYAVAMDGKDQVWVADQDNNRVQVFTKDGTFVRAFSGGEGEGQFKSPKGLLITKGGEVIVSEEVTNRVQIFDGNNLRLLRKFGKDGEELGELSGPFGMAMDSAGQLLVTEYYNSRVQVLQLDGTPVTAFGSEGEDDGEFNHPSTVCVDAYGRVAVGDETARVQVFSFRPASPDDEEGGDGDD